jgi:hypothetical protein
VLDSGTGTYAKGISAICEINPEFDSVDEFMTLVSAQPKCGEIKHVLNTNGLWKLDTKLIKDKIFS